METSSVRGRLLVGTFITVLIVGSGVATALVASSDQPTTTEAPETSTSTGDTADTTPASTPGITVDSTPDGETGDAPDGDATGPAARYTGPECGDGELTNHGQYVSSQPKDDESRSTAAQSDCGKPLTSIGDGEGDAPESGAPESGAPESGTAPSNSGSDHGNSANAPGHNK